jgi:apolipoprotein N-acyltransferase
MCIPLLGFHRTKKQLGENWGYLAMICYWLTFEFIHLRWDLSWPWLTLGNGFSAFPWAVQWYEYTGVPGGTLWILLVNIFIYKLLKKTGFVIAGQSNFTFRIKDLIPPMSLLLLPVFFSLILYYSYQGKG